MNEMIDLESITSGYESQSEIMKLLGYSDYFPYWLQEIGLNPNDLNS